MVGHEELVESLNQELDDKDDELAEIAAGEKKFDDCVALLNKVLARDGLHYDALLLRARLKLAQREAEEGRLAVESLPPSDSRDSLIHLLAFAVDRDR